MTEEQPKKREKLPANALVDVFADQQNITLDKPKGGKKNERNANDG